MHIRPGIFFLLSRPGFPGGFLCPAAHPFPVSSFFLHTVLIYLIYGIAFNNQFSHAFHLLFYYMRKFWIGPHIYYRKKEKGDPMSEHKFPAMTPVDALVSDDSLQAIKACIPFFGANEQPALLAFAKFMEFRKSLQLAREQKDELAACSMDPSMRTPAHMLNAIKEYCTQEQRRSIENLMNAMQMLQLIQMFQMPSSDTARPAASDSMELLSGMLSDEQKNLFRQFSETVQHQNARESNQEIVTGGEGREPAANAVAR